MRMGDPLGSEEIGFEMKPPKSLSRTPVPVVKEEENQDEDNAEIRPPDKEEEEPVETVDQGALPRHTLLPVSHYACTCTPHCHAC